MFKRMVAIKWAIVSEKFDMSDSKTELVLYMEYCRFEMGLNFARSSFARLDFEHSQFNRGANFFDVSTQSDFWVDHLQAKGELSLNRVRIGGQLSACNSNISNSSGNAIDAQGAEIKDGVFLDEAKLEGCLNFYAATVGGQFSTNDAILTNQHGDALSAQNTEIKEGLFIRRAKVKGPVSLNGARIGGQLSANSSTFSTPAGNAIHAQGAWVEEGAYFFNTTVLGCARFMGVTIGGQFNVRGTTFSNPNGDALNLQGAMIGDSTWLIDFPHHPIGSLNFVNASLGHIVIDNNSYPLGPSYLEGATYQNIHNRSHVNDIANCEGWLKPLLEHKSGNMIRPHNFWSGYRAVKTYLEKELKSENLSPEDLSKRTVMYMDQLVESGHRHTRHPNSYREFARVLEINGHEREARDVRIEAGYAYTNRTLKSFATARSTTNNLLAKSWYAVQAITFKVWRTLIRYLIGYGAKPLQVAYWLLGLWIVGIIIFWASYDDMTPARERFYMTQVQYEPNGKTIKSFDELSPRSKLPKGYPNYSPLIYALDVMLPVVDFAQESHWRPKNVERREGIWFKNLNGLRIFNRIYLGLGWLFSTIAVLCFTGLISDRKDK